MGEERVLKLNTEELKEKIGHLHDVFDIVRVIDPLIKTEYEQDCDGCLKAKELKCYLMWERKVPSGCVNCSSTRALQKHTRETKFEFSGDEIYHVISQFILVNGEPKILEMMSHITDSTLMDADGGNEEFVEMINRRNKILYFDSLTSANNRRYYDEQICATMCPCGFAVLDADNFKGINDGFGHEAGDQALKTIVEAALKHTGSTDSVIRYGGDEFLIIMRGCEEDKFKDTLEAIRSEIETTKYEKYQDMKVTVSIGAARGMGVLGDMFKTADNLLYEAKKTRNCIKIGLYQQQSFM